VANDNGLIILSRLETYCIFSRLSENPSAFNNFSIKVVPGPKGVGVGRGGGEGWIMVCTGLICRHIRAGLPNSIPFRSQNCLKGLDHENSVFNLTAWRMANGKWQLAAHHRLIFKIRKPVEVLGSHFPITTVYIFVKYLNSIS
jgi:hypothetical protein